MTSGGRRRRCRSPARSAGPSRRGAGPAAVSSSTSTADQDITAANSAGKVVIRDFPATSLPYAAFRIIGIYVTPDLANATGDYERPFLNELHGADRGEQGGRRRRRLHVRRAAQAGARLRRPAPGTIFRVPAVFVGGAEARAAEVACRAGASARVTVRAKVDRAKTQNVIATLPGRSKQRIILGANTDGQSWVQENGVAGMIAFARYYAGLPQRCRPRTLEIAFTSAHDAIVSDGTDRYASAAGRAVRQGQHRVRLRRSSTSARGRSCRTARAPGSGSPAKASRSCSAPATATCCARRRRPPPSGGSSTAPRSSRASACRRPGQVPPICSMGGLGTVFHRR